MADVIIIDDSGLIRLKVRKMLEKEDHNVYEAANSNQVKINTFSSEIELSNIDLILLDYPFENDVDFNLLKYLSSNFPSIPVVIISAENKRQIVMEAFDMGAKDYILKPFDNETFLSRLNSYLVKNTEKDNVSIFDKNYSSFTSTLSAEIDRAVRSGKSFTVGKFKSEEEIKIEKLKLLKEYVTNTIRRIDRAYVISQDIFILLLPLTDKEGFEILWERLNDAAAEFIENLEELIEIDTVTFPDDIIEEVEYDKVDIYRNGILKELNLN